MKKAIRRTQAKKASVMIVPEGARNSKFLSFSPWVSRMLVVCAVLAIMFLAASAAGAYGKMLAAKQEYKANMKKIGKLTAANRTQKEDVEALLDKSSKMEQEAKANVETLQKMKAAVGLTNGTQTASATAVFDGRLASSRSLADEIIEKEDADLTAQIDAITANMKELNQLVSTQAVEITNSKKSIQSKQAYLAAVPQGQPVQFRITAAFGYRKNPFTNRGSENHTGIDFAAPMGSAVHATGAGTVVFAAYNKGYGNLVIIDHGYGLRTYYAHNSELLVKQGDKVKRGDVVSKSGSTGRSTAPHCHYEVRVDGEPVNPANYF